MKKIFLQFIKTHEQKSKLDLITELLTSGIIEDDIELFNKVKSNFQYKMEVYKNKKEAEIKLINRNREVKLSDPNFNKPLSEIETTFEIVKPN